MMGMRLGIAVQRDCGRESHPSWSQTHSSVVEGEEACAVGCRKKEKGTRPFTEWKVPKCS